MQLNKIGIASGVIESSLDLNLHLEEVNGDFLSLARRNILIPNQEWIRQESFPLLKAVDEIWAKTRLAERLFSEIDCKVRFLGWRGVDRRMAQGIAGKTLTCLHIAGSSLWKGTEQVLDVWSERPEWPLLRVLRRTHGYEGAPLPWKRRALSPNIEIITHRVDEEALIKMQNESAIHVCPSEAEGFGHIILESMSVGAVTITTNAPPMNEMITRENGVLVAVERSEPMSLGTRYFVDRNELAGAIDAVLGMSEHDRDMLGKAARSRFEVNNAAFATRLQECLES